MIPIVTDVEVVTSERQGAYHLLTYRHADLARGTRPGQFLNVAVDPCNGFLRLPFSVAWTDATTGECAIAFDPIGAGTQWLADRSPGDRIDVVGPLGHGFQIDWSEGADLVIGGGYGAAALVGLASSLAERGRTVVSLLGARGADRLMIDPRMERACTAIVTTTEDGSAGVRGRVTDVLDDLVAQHEIGTIYACGPNPMLAALASAGRRLGIRTQLAVEEFMACGIGVCWTCVIPVETPDGIAHLRACTDGPVFEGEALAWT